MCVSFVVLISIYLLLQEGEMWFSEELFLDHKSSSMRQFLQSAIHLQFFKQVHTVPLLHSAGRILQKHWGSAC